MTNYKEMLQRAKSGTLSSTEIASVAQELRNPFSQADPYTLLHILGKGEARSYADLVAQYLEYAQDPMVALLALQILCNYWGYGSQYIDRLKQFLAGVPWDSDGEVRSGAASVAGEVLRSNRDADLLAELIRIFEDQSESQSMRESAYLALARADGLDWKQLPPASRHFDLETETQPSVIENAKRALNRKMRS